jgi:ABC-2 type transport system ATP-binding protein
MNTTNRDEGAAIEVRRLRKTYPGGVEAVRGLDFRVARGEVFGLLGPNGAGKSTTIGMLTTAVRPTAGTALVAGVDVVRRPLAARRASAVVFQEAVVDRALTGRHNLDIHARLWGVDPLDRDRTIALTVGRFGLDGLVDRPVGTYSGGERRRLELARALLSRPSVLFLDEPTVGLDPRMRHELLDVIAGLGDDRQMTVVLTTHYLDEAERLCDRVAVVHRGEIVALDTPAGLLATLGPQVVEVRVAGGDREVGRIMAAFDASAAFAVGSTVTIPLIDRDWRAVTDAIDVTGVSVIATTTRPPSLDDVYLKLTGDRLAA